MTASAKEERRTNALPAWKVILKMIQFRPKLWLVNLGAMLILMMAFQIPGLVRHGFKWLPRLGIRHPDVRKVARLMLPRILNIGTFQLVFVVHAF